MRLWDLPILEQYAADPTLELFRQRLSTLVEHPLALRQLQADPPMSLLTAIADCWEYRSALPLHEELSELKHFASQWPVPSPELRQKLDQVCVALGLEGKHELEGLELDGLLLRVMQMFDPGTLRKKPDHAPMNFEFNFYAPVYGVLVGAGVGEPTARDMVDLEEAWGMTEPSELLPNRIGSTSASRLTVWRDNMKSWREKVRAYLQPSSLSP